MLKMNWTKYVTLLLWMKKKQAFMFSATWIQLCWRRTKRNISESPNRQRSKDAPHTLTPHVWASLVCNLGRFFMPFPTNRMARVEGVNVSSRNMEAGWNAARLSSWRDQLSLSIFQWFLVPSQQLNGAFKGTIVVFLHCKHHCAGSRNPYGAEHCRSSKQPGRQLFWKCFLSSYPRLFFPYRSDRTVEGRRSNNQRNHPSDVRCDRDHRINDGWLHSRSDLIQNWGIFSRSEYMRGSSEKISIANFDLWL